MLFKFSSSFFSICDQLDKNQLFWCTTDSVCIFFFTRNSCPEVVGGWTFFRYFLWLFSGKQKILTQEFAIFCIFKNWNKNISKYQVYCRIEQTLFFPLTLYCSIILTLFWQLQHMYSLQVFDLLCKKKKRNSYEKTTLILFQ